MKSRQNHRAARHIGIMISIIICLIIGSNLYSSGKDRSPVLLYNYEDRKSPVRYEYNFISNPNLTQNDFNQYPLVLQNNVTAPECIKTHYTGRVYCVLSAGDAYEMGTGGSEKLIFNITCNVTVHAVNQADEIIPGEYKARLNIRVNGNEVIPEDIEYSNAYFYDGDELISKFVITDIEFIEDYSTTPDDQRILNLKESLYLELFYTIEKKVDARLANTPDEPILAVDYYGQPTGPNWYSYYVSTSSGTMKNYMNPVRLSWQFINNGCMLSDLEIPNYQVQILKLENLNERFSSYLGQVEADIDWSRALNIYSDSKPYVDVTLTQGSGYYMWRVRPIGNYYPGGIANSRNYGAWNKCKSSGGAHGTLPPTDCGCNGTTIMKVSQLSKFFYIEYYQDDNTLNWIHTRSISEDQNSRSILNDKIEHYDDALKLRQTSYSSVSQDLTLVTQNFYDHLGRNTISTLSFPSRHPAFYPFISLFWRSLSYKKNVMGTGAGTFNWSDYDNGSLNLLPFNSGLLNEYYDGDIDLGYPGFKGFVPSAEGYPYKRTLFFEDGTNRVWQTGDVGATLNVFKNPPNANDPPKTSSETGYANVSDDEILPILGDEAPAASKVLKTSSIDPNHMETISYIDSYTGKTIASVLNPVISYPNTSMQQLDNENLYSFNVKYYVTDYNRIPGTDTYWGTKTINLPNTTNQVTASYRVSNAQLNISGICPAIPAFCANIGVNSTLSFTKIGTSNNLIYAPNTVLIPYHVCPSNIQTNTPPNWVFNAGKGNHIARREITLLVDQAKIDLDAHIASHYNSTIIDPFFNNLFTSIDNVVDDPDQMDLTNFYNTLQGAGWSYDPANRIYTYTSAANCMAVTIPKILCKNECKMTINGHNGASATNYEQFLIDSCGAMVHNAYELDGSTNLDEHNISSYFYEDLNVDGTLEKLYPSTGTLGDNTSVPNGNGAFNRLIENMADPAQGNYDPESLCDCWTTSVEMFKTRGLKEKSGSGGKMIGSDEFNLLENFLECTGKKYKGISNRPYGNTVPPGTERTSHYPPLLPWSDYGKGYLEYAYEYFYYNPMYRAAPRCEFENTGHYFRDIHFTSIFPIEFDLILILDPGSFGNDEQKWGDFYMCERSERPIADVKKKIKDENDAAKNKQIDGNKVFESLVNKYGLPDCLDYPNTEISAECVEKAIANLVGICEENCDRRNFDFKVKTLFRAAASHFVIEGDHDCKVGGVVTQIHHWGTSDHKPYSVSNVEITPDNPIKLQSDVDLYVNILKAHCKAECYLSTNIEYQTDVSKSHSLRVGTDEERESFNHAMNDDYEIEFPDVNGECVDTEQPPLNPWTPLGERALTDGRYVPTKKAYFKWLLTDINNAFDQRISQLLAWNENRWAYEYGATWQTRRDNCVAIRNAINNFDNLTPYDGGLNFNACYSCEQSSFNEVYPQLGGSCNGGLPMKIPQATLSLATTLDVYGIREYLTYKHNIYFHRDPTNCNLGIREDEWIIFPKYKWLKIRGCANANCTGTTDWATRYVDKFVINTYDGQDYLLWARTWQDSGRAEGAIDEPHTVYAYGKPGFDGYWAEYKFLRDPITFDQGPTKICFRWKSRPEITEENKDIKIKNCKDETANLIKIELALQRNKLIRDMHDNYVKAMDLQIANMVNNPAILNEEFKIQFNSSFQHYTLYYYDRAGNLVRTVSPKGVKHNTARTRINGTVNANPDHDFSTVYKYNSLGNVEQVRTPDEGDVRKTFYDRFNRVRFTMDPEQKNRNLITYFKYDNQNRLIETGEAVSPAPPQDDQILKIMAYGDPIYPATNDHKLSYSEFFFAEKYSARHGDLPEPYNDYNSSGMNEQKNIRNRLSYAVRHNARLRQIPQPGVPMVYNDVYSIYSYDIHGNIDWVIQVVPKLNDYVPYPPSGNIVSKIGYDYNLISNTLNKMIYNEDRTDALFQRFEYDDDNRVRTVYSSRNPELWDKDYQYEYNLHGPLSRTIIGEDLLTCSDYYYTPQGWLKAVNPGALTADKGKEEGLYGFNTAPDQFGFVLNYFQNDFINSAAPDLNNPNARLFLPTGKKSLYNGNIAATEFSYSDYIRNNKFAPNDMYYSLNGSYYRYDYLSRLITSSTSLFSTYWMDYQSYSPFGYGCFYDANGNFRYQWYNKKDGMGLCYMDYTAPSTYATVDGRPTNRLVSSTGTNPASKGYGYDRNGNIINEQTNGSNIINNVEWTFDGKIYMITKSVTIPSACCTTGTWPQYTRFIYDAQGNRVARIIEMPELHSWMTTVECPSCADCYNQLEVNANYYLRDANEEIIAIYDQDIKLTGVSTHYENTGCDPYFNVKVKQWQIYGSQADGRIATVLPETYGGVYYSSQMQAITVWNFYRQLGFKQYELKDHLGNVRVVFNDIKEPRNLNLPKSSYAYDLNIEDVSTYYPYGAMMNEWSSPNPSTPSSSGSYLFGFNGMFRDDEIKGTGKSLDFGARMLDPWQGRFLSLDPMQIKFPSLSPYTSMANNPILNIDPDGMETYVSDYGKLRTDKTIQRPDDPSVLMISYDADGNEVFTNIGTYDAKKKTGNIDVSTILYNLFKYNAPIAQAIKGDYLEFYDKVATGKIWDYKNRKDMIFSLGFDSKNDKNIDGVRFNANFSLDGSFFNFSDMTASDVGNLHAGFVGPIAGFSDIDLFLGAGLAEMAKDLQHGELQPHQIKEFEGGIAPYGDERRDYDYNKNGMDLSRKWCKQYHIKIKVHKTTLYQAWIMYHILKRKSFIW